ncbi:MAG: GntR family transcriptional regulator [Beijerinckiaceae bacterium]|nr:GntR family transcriptional regulator [Beijerinckiaceae bacterium]MDO9440227.1 GntR family transcriptional regulator [Beijerinckiaceae bacterium]
MLSVATASKTQRLYLLLRHQILGGELNVGDKLPSEPELGALHGVSRVTVRRVLGQLEDEGFISRQPGVGTFVKERAVSRPIVAELSEALANLNEMGRATSVKLLSFAYVQPPAHVAAALNITRETRTQRSVRIRLSNKDPFSYLLTHVPERISSTYSEQELATQSFLSLLERSGVRIARATQTVTATLATPEISEALKVDIGAPLLSITRVNFDEAGVGVQHLQAYYRPDRYRFEMHLVRGKEAEEFVWAADTRGARKDAAA